MATFEIEAPDGTIYDVEGENEQGAFEALEEMLNGAPSTPEDTSIMPEQGSWSLKSLFEGLLPKETEEDQAEMAAKDKEIEAIAPDWLKTTDEVKEDFSYPDKVLSNIPGGAVEGGRQLVGTTLAAGDAVANTMPTWLGGDAEGDSNVSEEFYKNTPEFKSEGGVLGELVSETAGIATGVAAGVKTGAKVLGKHGGKIKNWAKKILAGEAGGVSAMDPELEGLFVGEDGLLLEGLAVDDEGNFSENLLQKRLNLLADAIITVKVGQTALKGVRGSGRLIKDYGVKPMLGLLKGTELEKVIGKDLFHRLKGINMKDTPEDEFKKIGELIEAVEENKEKLIPTGDADIPDVEIKRDSLSAYDRSLDNSTREGAVAKARVRGVREGISGKGAPQLEGAMSEASRESERLLTDIERVSGGPQEVNKAREEIQDSVLGQQEAMLDDLDATKTKIIDSKKSVQDLIDNDPFFGQGVLDELGKTSNIDMSSVSVKSADDILDVVRQVDEEMTAEKTELFNAIPEGIHVNMQSLADAVLPVQELLSKASHKMFREAGDDFKKLHDFARLHLQKEINSYLKVGKIQEARALEEFKTNIVDEQLDYLVVHGDTRARDVIQKANDHFKNVYAPLWRDGKLQELQMLGREHRLQPINKAEKQRDVLRSTLEDPNHPDYTKQIINVLKKKGNAKLAVDYVLSRTADDVQKILNNKKKLTSDEIIKFDSNLSRFVPILDEVDPQQVARINDFLTKIRNSDLSTLDLEDSLKFKEKKYDQEIKELFGGEFKPFFDDHGGKKVARENSDNVFSEVFDSPEVVRDLPKIMKGTKDTKGLRAAYSNRLIKSLFRDKQGNTGEHKVSPMRDDDLERLYNAGDILFEDKPQLMQAVRATVKEAVETERSRSATKLPSFDLSEVRKSASGVVDFAITQMFGALNRWGARFRSAAGRVLGKLDPKDQAAVILDSMIANPDEFIRVMKEVQKDIGKDLSRKSGDELLRFLSRSTYYGTAGQPDEDEQTKQVFE